MRACEDAAAHRLQVVEQDWAAKLAREREAAREKHVRGAQVEHDLRSKLHTAQALAKQADKGRADADERYRQSAAQSAQEVNALKARSQHAEAKWAEQQERLEQQHLELLQQLGLLQSQLAGGRAARETYRACHDPRLLAAAGEPTPH